MDERLQRNPNIQIAGSVQGLGADIVVADTLRNSLWTGKSPQTAAKLAHQVLRGVGVWSELHEQCAGEELLAIAQSIVEPTNHDKLAVRISALYGEMSESQLDRIIGTYGLLLRERAINRTDSARNELADDPSIPREPIEAGPHKAGTVIAMHGRTSFATRKAFQERNEAYAIGFGQLERVADRISPVTSLKPEDLMLASLVRQAATTLALPHPEAGKTGDDLAILTHGMPYAA